MENIVETYNVNYNFYPDKLNIKTDLTITLSEGFPPFKLELELELKDENIVSIDCTYIISVHIRSIVYS